MFQDRQRFIINQYQFSKIFQRMINQQSKEFEDKDLQYPINFDETLPIVEDIESLIHQAKNFKILQDQFKKEKFFTRDYYYILSTKWLRRWKQYVSYDSSISAAPPNKFLGKGKLPKINEDIVKINSQITACFQQQLSHLNVVLVEGLHQQKDYVFLSEQMWQIFRKYQHFQVKRFTEEANEGKKIELYFQQVNLNPMFADFLKQIERQKSHKLMHIKLQVSHYIEISKFQDLVKHKLKDYVSANCFARFAKDLPVRMWLMPQDTRPNILVNVLMTGCKANPTFTYKLYSQGQYMIPQKRICDYDILSTSLILVQMLQEKQNWVFWNQKKPFFGQCGNCKSNQQLKFVCSCKYALYCSKKCKSDDKSHHKFRCPNDCESDQEEVQITFNDQSKYGLTGLRNLGNTCFMNSGLQCLSHITQLTNYFLEDKYLSEINKQNPLGTKGQLSTAYAKMLKSLWMGNEASISPTQLKRAIGKFQPMFMGYNQHDSGELVSYLLDGLHQDLNRIKQKPYVQTKDYDGRPDFIIAKQAWENYLKRNLSIVTDLMFGQFKSIVDCPKCQYQSIQFDPFLMCTLPIVNDNLKKVQIFYLKDNFYTTSLTVCYDASWGWKMTDLFDDVKKKLCIDPQQKLLAYITSYSVCQPLNDSQSVEYVRQEHKYRQIYIRNQLQGQNPKTDVHVSLANVVCHSYYGNQSYRKNIAPYRLYYFNRSTTLKEVHHKIYNLYQSLYPVQNYQQEVINAPQKQQPFRILTIPGSRFSKCQYCGIKGCQGCIMKYDNLTTIGDIVTDDNKKGIEVELYWRKQDKQIQKRFDEIKQDSQKSGGNGNDKQAKKKSGTTIQQCFKLFEQPEILAEDNAWYCPKCKDFVLAKKQMQIYKAPKILILCLKRFKRKQYYSEKYNIMVDFPLQNFDISEYVLNHNLPGQYFKGQTQENTQQGKLIYDLVGITNHFGGTGGGHYTAYCKDPKSQKWFDFDDSCVDQLKSSEDAVTESAYMLYYKKRM